MKPITPVELRRLKPKLAAVITMIEGGTPWFCRCRCRDRLDHAYRVAEQAHGVLKAASGGRGSSDHADPVFAYVYPALSGLGKKAEPEQVDPSSTWLEGLTDKARALTDALADFMVVLHTVGYIETSDPRSLSAAGTGSGNCQACEHLCTAVGDDRLKSGFCPRCYTAWGRAGRPDRYGWCRQRRVDLADVNFDPFMDGADIIERLNPGHEHREVG